MPGYKFWFWILKEGFALTTARAQLELGQLLSSVAAMFLYNLDLSLRACIQLAREHLWEMPWFSYSAWQGLSEKQAVGAWSFKAGLESFSGQHLL